MAFSLCVRWVLGLRLLHDLGDQAMTDIVDRLRSMLACDLGCEGRCYDCPSTAAKEAADEIEWLRGERNRLAADLAKAHLDIVAWIKKAQEAYR